MDWKCPACDREFDSRRDLCHQCGKCLYACCKCSTAQEAGVTSSEMRHQLELKTSQERLKRDLIELKGEVVVLAASGDPRLADKMTARLARCVARVDELVTMAGSAPSTVPSVEPQVPSPHAGPASFPMQKTHECNAEGV